MKPPAALLLLAVQACGLGCEPPVRRSEFSLDVTTHSETGAPVAGARIWTRHGPLGTTDTAGHLAARVEGSPGALLELQVSCPTGYADDAPNRRIVLPDDAPPGRPLTTDIRCPSLTRALAIAVRTGMPELAGTPIVVDGEPRGSCGPDGAAHLLLRRQPGAQVRVVIDTRPTPGLRPQNPVHLISVPGEDSVSVIEQRFERYRPRRRRRPPRTQMPPPSPRPYRIR